VSNSHSESVCFVTAVFCLPVDTMGSELSEQKTNITLLMKLE
jgi:hypothetical protein